MCKVPEDTEGEILTYLSTSDAEREGAIRNTFGSESASSRTAHASEKK